AKVAAYLKTNHHELMVSYRDAMELVDEMVNVYDEPYADSSAIPTMLVSKLARKHVTMTLSGDGGDETYLGYGAYSWAERLNNPLFRMFKKPLSFSLSFMNRKLERGGRVFNYYDSEKIKSHIFSQEQYLFSEFDLDAYLLPQWREPIHLNERYDSLKRKLNVSEEQAF